MKRFIAKIFFRILGLTAVMLGTLLISKYAIAQTAAQITSCLKALNGHKTLKFKKLSEAELTQVALLEFGLSKNELALFILTSGKAIGENCPKNVTDYFVGKFDSTFILHVKRLAAQGSCADLASCNARARDFEKMVKELNGGSAGLARANLADDRYTKASSNALFESAEHSVCCAGPTGSNKVNAGPGGYCDERKETIYPCFGYTTAPLKESDPGRASFYKRFGKDRELSEWIRNYGGGNLSRPNHKGAPAVSPAASGFGR